MLSKFFNSARNLFVPPPQASNHEYAVDGAAEAEMVTTRSRNTSQEDGSGEENTIVVEMPSSSRKRSRKNVEESEDDGEEEEEVVVPAKKQKILPLRERDEVGVNRHTRVVVEIPVMSLPVDVRSPRADLEEDVEEFGEESEDDEAVEEIQKEPLRLEIADSESDGEEEDDETPEPELPSNKKARPSKFIEEPLSTPASTKPKHKRFGSEELEVEPEFFSTAAEIVDSDEESSDDDAPEVVGAQDAMERAQSKAREAAEAAEEQEAAVRKKRQERDAVLKKQADVAAKRRKREAEKAEKLSKKARKAEAEAKAEEANIDTEKAMPTPLISRSNIPDLLPEEYLQDDDEDSDELDGSETEVVRRNPKKMKFSELVEKKPKDRRKGSTTYRVSEVQSRILAPKPSFHAKATKESWLKRRAGKGPGGIRKVASTGFFKKK